MQTHECADMRAGPSPSAGHLPHRQSQLDLDQPHAGPTRRRYLSGGERPRRRVVRPATPAGQPFRQPTTKAHLEPLPEVPTHTAHPSATPQTPHLPYRQLERKYDQSVIPSGCSVEAHSVETTNLNCAAPRHRNRVSHIGVRPQSAPAASMNRNRASGAARARARRLKNGRAGRRPSQLGGGASFPVKALPLHAKHPRNAFATHNSWEHPTTRASRRHRLDRRQTKKWARAAR